MDRLEQFKINADDAERYAQAAPSQAEREAWLKIAKDWRDMIVVETQRRAGPKKAP